MKLMPGVERAVDDPDRLVVVGVAPGAEHHRAEAQRADLTPVRPSVRCSMPPPYDARRVPRVTPREPATRDEELLNAASPLIASLDNDPARIERMRGELETGFRSMARLGPAVSVFGSARTPV